MRMTFFGREWSPAWPALFLLTCLVVACATEPYTGRSQFLMLSRGEEAQLGATAFQEVLSTSTRSTNGSYKSQVESVGRAIVAQIDPKWGMGDLQWEFEVIADSQVNAFALPGGKVAFYEGILPICGSETGIAVVMGHEIGHVIARHGNERVSQGQLANAGLQAAQIVGSMIGTEEDAQVRNLAMGALGLGVQYGVILPFSRKHETSADYIGLQLMAKAGYDPREAVRFWQRMADQSGGSQPSEWMSTHPSHDTRIADLEAALPEAMVIYDRVRQR